MRHEAPGFDNCDASSHESSWRASQSLVAAWHIGCIQGVAPAETAYGKRALALYTREGLVREGRLRDVLRETGSSWSSLIVMSLLETDHAP